MAKIWVDYTGAEFGLYCFTHLHVLNPLFCHQKSLAASLGMCAAVTVIFPIASPLLC